MSQPEQITIGTADIESLAGKLETMLTGLNEREQAILSLVLQAAADSASEVSGFAGPGFNPGISFNLSVAVGFTGVSREQLHDIPIIKYVDKSSAKLT